MTSRTGGRLLVDQLLAQGCERIFTVPGESFLAVLDALHDTPAIDLVVCRQEGGAAFMACADGTLTGRPGIAFVTRGPGATNASIGVHVAMQDSQPMILFIGDVDRGTRDREAFQEVDFQAMFAPLCKWAARIDDAARIPEYIARAYATAMNGRPGPVVLALPEDMLIDQVEALDRPRIERTTQACDPAALADLGALVERAERPLMLVGGAGWTEAAGHTVADWAARRGIPVACAFRRQDAIDNQSPAWAGNLGYGPNPALVARVRAADLLIVAGPRLGEATTDGYVLVTPDHPGQTLVHVHPDPEELHRTYRTDLAICAGMEAFGAALQSVDGRSFTDGAAAHEAYRSWSEPVPRAGVALDLGQCVGTMRDTLPADTIICNGAGNYSGWWHRYWRYAGPGTQLAPTAGAMGYGLPAAVAASLRHPGRSVVALAGDGCFLMNGQELATAVQTGASILVIVVDNGAYGTIRMHQEREFPGRISGTRLANPDFAALARAYGAWAETVETTDAFGPALARAQGETGVRLLHLKTQVEVITPAAMLSDIARR
ncbi:acetolactate synthase-1/2/3 large subunit [Sphingomonas sp. SORGH_AS802]|uniref:thiamine pyrophosphate-binding protein n=1 Tax=unclassified Sphingomonas TaxID=196159 RepID=UPI0028630048|nr:MULTISPECIES: thiamine pyrophosphate-binding protein [unclassified Sphingomonas]MDR6126320.1 acetolactate synthase-1/2/3 large subunit [Sphingomonas sp. SORGH_AS_0438]MDR6135835.1 acetolactate synthase-1/2/3 large subunit [Sphingomonas sp. SORGH_AS_0802]